MPAIDTALMRASNGYRYDLGLLLNVETIQKNCGLRVCETTFIPASASLRIETICVPVNRDRFILSLLRAHQARKFQFLPVAQMGKLTMSLAWYIAFHL